MIRDAIVLAGGKAERLGEAAEGRPKSLVRVGERPLLAYQIALLVRAGVERVIVSCAAGKGEVFATDLAGLGVEIVPVEEPEPLGRGGGLRFAAAAREHTGDVYALNGDELVDLDLRRAARASPGDARGGDDRGRPARIALRRRRASTRTTPSRASGRRPAPHWVNCGVYVLGAEALERGCPSRATTSTTTFPARPSRVSCEPIRHEGLWMTVNTPKDLRIARRSTSRRAPRVAGSYFELTLASSRAASRSPGAGS